MKKGSMFLAVFLLLGALSSSPSLANAVTTDDNNDHQGQFHPEHVLDHHPKNPICWKKPIRCENHQHCSAAQSSNPLYADEPCNECYGYVVGRRMSGLCGVNLEKSMAAKREFFLNNGKKNEFNNFSPQQLRIAQGKTPTSMSVMWITESPYDGDDNGFAPIAEYTKDLSGKSGWKQFSGTTSTYSSHCGGDRAPKYLYTSGFIHTVHLLDLEPQTRYLYRVGNGSEWVQREFKTLPAVGDHSPFSVGIVGDLGQTAFSAQTIENLRHDTDISMILHVGDMSYADCDHFRWDSWGGMVDDLASSLPYMVCAGNHEIEGDPMSNTTFLAYKRRFSMPQARHEEDSTPPSSIPYPNCVPSAFKGNFNFGNSFYSFSSGMTHVIVLNSYADTAPSSRQFQFLLEDLKGIDRNLLPWVIVFTHSPIYNSNEDHQNETMAIEFRKNFEPLFFQFRVNLVFCGHVHAYERTLEVFDDSLMRKENNNNNNNNNSSSTSSSVYLSGGAPIYIVLGDGGNREGHSPSYLSPQPIWSAFRDGSKYGSGKLTFFDRNRAQFLWLKNDGEGGGEGVEVGDSVEIVNDEKMWGRKK